jgi:hypothetical protein
MSTQFVREIRTTEARRRRLPEALCFLCLCLSVTSVSTGRAQQLIDRVLARLEGHTITLSDVRAAIGIGLVSERGASPGSGAVSEQDALQQVIDRQLLLNEVQRFPPPEPPPAGIDAEVAVLKARAGAGLPALMQSTGLDDRRIREMARETLRINAYLDQRFGTTVQVSDDEVDRYYRAHQDEFVRDGLLIPFAEAEPIARRGASAERLRTTIAQWIRDLRMRADVVLTAR